ncbi:hypothetical protein MKX03_027481, partial [Papaver bracteatum]
MSPSFLRHQSNSRFFLPFFLIQITAITNRYLVRSRFTATAIVYTEGGELRCWDELLPDALEMIFKKLSLQDMDSLE